MSVLADLPSWLEPMPPRRRRGEPIDFSDLEDAILWREASAALGRRYEPLDSDEVRFQ